MTQASSRILTSEIIVNFFRFQAFHLEYIAKLEVAQTLRAYLRNIFHIFRNVYKCDSRIAFWNFHEILRIRCRFTINGHFRAEFVKIWKRFQLRKATATRFHFIDHGRNRIIKKTYLNSKNFGLLFKLWWNEIELLNIHKFELNSNELNFIKRIWKYQNMQPNILVTGTPGAGKTHFAKEIAEKYGLKFLEISRIVQDHGFTDGFDETLDCPILDEDKVSNWMESRDIN